MEGNDFSQKCIGYCDPSFVIFRAASYFLSKNFLFFSTKNCSHLSAKLLGIIQSN